MSQRAVWILAACTALLVGYVLLFERTSLTSKELDARQGRVLGSFVRERVDRLEIQRANKTVVLERKPLEDGTLGPWQMLEPEKAEADQDAVDQVLGELEWLSARRTLENVSDADAKSFGLSAPRYRIWYRVGDERHLLAVGNPDVHGQSVYVRTENSKTAQVVPKTLTEALDHPVGHFRSKDFLGTIVIGWARKVEIERGAQKLVLSRAEGDSRWWFEPSSPEQGPRGYADGRHIDSTLSALDDLKATRYLEEGPLLTGAKVALGKPELSVRINILPDEKREDETPRLVLLRVAGPCPEHADERLAQAGDQGPVVCVAEDGLKAVEADFATFRQPGLLAVDPSQIEAFELSSGTRKLALKRDGENWVGASKEQQVDRMSVELWLAQLAALRANAYLPLEKGQETARLSLTMAGDKHENVVVFAAKEPAMVPVQRGDEPALVTFPAALSDLLDPAPNRFTSLTPWEAQQPSEFGTIDAKVAAFARALVFTDGAWTSAGKPLSPDAELHVRELVKTLLKTQALSFVSEKVRPEHGLGTPQGSCVLGRKPGPDGKVGPGAKLDLGANSARGLYARFDGGPVLEVDARVLGWVQELAGGPAQAPLTPAPNPAAESEEDAEDLFHAHEH